MSTPMNPLRLNLLGKTVLLDPDIFPMQHDPHFIVTGGPGADPSLPGEQLVGYFVADGPGRYHHLSSRLVTTMVEPRMNADQRRLNSSVTIGAPSSSTVLTAGVSNLFPSATQRVV